MGSQVNVQDEWGRSALIFAAKNNLLGVTKLLIEAGADLEAYDEY